MNITGEGFLQIDITPAMRARAAAKAQEMGQLRNSIRKGEGNIAGFLGEELVLAGFGCASSRNTYQHDLVVGNSTFEVKTKDRTVRPQILYEASVANYNATQQADFYVFTSLYRDESVDTKSATYLPGDEYITGYVAGVIDKDDYKREAIFLRVGEVDPTNGWKVSADCYNLPYSRLMRFSRWREDA